MDLAAKIKSSPRLRKVATRLLVPSNDNKPRAWVRWFLNPFMHSKGKGSRIRNRTRMDVFPYNRFELGAYSIIEDFSTINNAVGDVYIGRDTIIGMGNVIIGPVTIGNHVMLAQNIIVSGLNHGYEKIGEAPKSQPVICKPITVEDDVWIGANSVITAGVHIGKHAIIGAGSVVTKNVPSYSVAVGNPAKVIKQYNKATTTWEKV